MAITRTIHRIDIQWTDTDDGAGGTFKEPVFTVVGEFIDDVEETVAGKHLSTLRSDLGPTAQAKLDAFLTDMLAFAASKVAGPIGYPQ